MTAVIVAFCHRADSISPQFRRSLTMVMMRDAATTRRIIAELDKESSANIATARCEIVRDFLNHPAKPDWLWMIDSDMTFGDGILDRLLKTPPEGAPHRRRSRFGVRPAKIDGEDLSECPVPARAVPHHHTRR